MLRHMRSSIYFVKNVFFQFKQARQYWLTSHEVNWVRQDILIIVSIYIYTFNTIQKKELQCSYVKAKFHFLVQTQTKIKTESDH